MEPASAPEALPPLSTPRIVNIQFFLLPALVALPFVLLVAFVAYLSQEETDPAALVETIRTGTPHSRWQAAMLLAAHLAKEGGEVPVEDLLSLWNSEAAKDPKVREYLLLAFARAKDPRVREVLVGALREGSENERFFAAWALSLWKDPAAAGALRAALSDPAPAVRKVALAGIAQNPALTPEARAEAAAPLLSDRDPDVRWNAAAVLAGAGDPRAVPVVAEMLDRKRVAAQPGVRPDAVEGVLLRGIELARRYPELADELARLAEEDPSLRVRGAIPEDRRSEGGR